MTTFHLDPQWVQKVSESIVKRQGVQYKDSLVLAEEQPALTVVPKKNNDTFSPAALHIPSLVEYCFTELENSVQATLSRSPPLLQVGSVSSGEGVQRNRQEVSWLVQTAARIAITGAVVHYMRGRNDYIVRRCVEVREREDHTVKKRRTDGAEEEEDEEPGSPQLYSPTADSPQNALVYTNLSRMMLKGLLHAFQSFQEVHGMERSHYPAREGSRTAGTVGWDTIVLLHFVHHIPHVARLAAEEAVAIEKHPDLTSDVRAAVDAEGDGGLFTGDVVRHWRRLLIAVQSADPTEAPEYSRRRGALSIVNGLLRVLFLHQNTHQCVMLLQAVEHTEETARTTGDTSKSILIPSKHITSEMVSYYYFKGRILIYQRRYEEALTALITSFEALPPLSYQASAAGPSKTPAQAIGREAQRNNKKRVTFFLCVAGLLAGRRCPPQVEAQGDDTMQCLFQPLYEAIGRGDPVRYTQALEQHGYVWRRRGVYVLLLQQGLLHCYLSLVKRVHLALGTLGVDNSRLTIPQLIAAYREIRGEGDRMAVEEEERSEMTEDRMVLWVTKLISIGYVKGYVSLEHMTVVVSKKEPFCQ